MKVFAALLLAVAACSGKPSDAAPAVAQTPAGEIALTGRVVDRAEVIPPEIEAQISNRLAALETETTDQLVVVTLPDLNGAPIEHVGLALGRSWKVGRADLNNGVVLLLAPRDRKVRIEVGNGLESLLTDDRAAKIVNLMVNNFRQGDFAGGVEVGVGEIEAVLRADTKRPQYRSEAQTKVAA